MNKINISTHTLMKYHLLFNKDKPFDEQFLTKEILSDFNNENSYINLTKKYRIYTSDKVKYVCVTHSNSIDIQTVFKLDDNISFDLNIKVRLITSSSIGTKILNELREYAFLNDFIILKHQGIRKIAIVDKYLMLIKVIENKSKEYSILNIVDLKTINSKKDIEEIKEKILNTISDNEFLLLLNNLGLLDIWHNSEIQQKQQLSIDENLAEIQIFKEVLSGERRSFPPRFWEDELLGTNHEATRTIIKYLFENILHWSKYDIYFESNFSLFKKYKLSGMLSRLYTNNFMKAVLEVYPDMLPWEFKNGTSSWFWSEDNNGKNNLLKYKKWLLDKMHFDGFIINENNLLQYDWRMLLKRYKVLGMLTVACKDNLQEFFKLMFNKDISIQEIEAYEYKFRSGAGEVKITI
jgi:hypothetical protein